MDYTARGLVAWCISLLGQGYVYGTYFSGPITQARIDQKALQYHEMFARKITYNGVTKTIAEWAQKWIGMNAGDCVGMIKAYYWTDDAGKVRYRYLDRVDTSADGMLRNATVKGGISTMPDRPGIFVHYPGHIGIYIGNGEVIESRGVVYGVVKTKRTSRPWGSWGEVPYVDYGDVDTVLQIGSKGAAVRCWQIRLMQWNPLALPKFKADSDFGAETQDWTNKFKTASGLPADGIVDDLTWDAMVEALKSDPAEIAQARSEIDRLTAELASAKQMSTSASDKLAAVEAVSEQRRARLQKASEAVGVILDLQEDW